MSGYQNPKVLTWWVNGRCHCSNQLTGCWSPCWTPSLTHHSVISFYASCWGFYPFYPRLSYRDQQAQLLCVWVLPFSFKWVHSTLLLVSLERARNNHTELEAAAANLARVENKLKQSNEKSVWKLEIRLALPSKIVPQSPIDDQYRKKKEKSRIGTNVANRSSARRGQCRNHINLENTERKVTTVVELWTNKHTKKGQKKFLQQLLSGSWGSFHSSSTATTAKPSTIWSSTSCLKYPPTAEAERNNWKLK